MTKDQLIESKKIKNIFAVVNKLEQDLHLSFSSLKETLEFLEEQELIKGIDSIEYLDNISLEYSKSKKANTKKFMEYIRETRNPFMYKAFNDLKGSLNGLKGANIKTDYPKNLEGDSINIAVELHSEEDVDRLIKTLDKNREKLKKAINIVKKGG